MMKCAGMSQVAEVVVRQTHVLPNVPQLTGDIEMIVHCCCAEEKWGLAEAVVAKAESSDSSMLNRERIAVLKCAVSERKIPNAMFPKGFATMQPELPPLIIQGWNFASAMAHWAANGFKMRSKGEIAKRLAICQSCEFLQNQTCIKCGCPCNANQQVMNKLALSTEVCPEGKWS